MTLLHASPVIVDEHGYELHMPPPSGIEGLTRGIPDHFAENINQLFPLGTKLVYGEQVFKYTRAGSVALDAGKVMQAVVPLAGHIDEVVNSAAADQAVIAFTPNTDSTDDVTANELSDGYIWINDDTGEAHLYRIKSHPAIAGAVSGNITLWDNVKLALGASATATVLHNLYRNVIVHPSPPTAAVVGVTPFAITASYYFWLHTWGPASVLGDGTLIINEDVVASDGTDGAVEAADAAIAEATPNTGHGERHLGYVMALNATAEYSGIYLQISR
jgi:hypothetical protein